MQVADLFARLRLKPDASTFDRGDKLISGIKTAVAGLIALKTGEFFGGMIKSTADTADRFNKMAQQIGISSESLQGLDYAAKLSGTDVDVLRNGLQRFARSAHDAAMGSKSAQETFSSLGVKSKNADGSLRAVDEILADVADKISTMPDGTEKTALAIRAFGRSGGQLIPLLNAGSAGIEKMKEEFGDLGGVIDTETGKSFEEFNDDQLRLSTLLTGLKNQIVIELLPTLKQITKDSIAWVKANKEMLKQRVTAFLKLLISGLKLVAIVGNTVLVVVTELTENMDLLVITLGTLAAAFLILRSASVGAALASAASWVIALAPFILLAAAIFALILVIEDLWVAFQGGESVFKDLYLAAKKWFGMLSDTISGEVEEAAADLLDTLSVGPFENPIAKNLRERSQSRKNRRANEERTRLHEEELKRQDEALPLQERILRRERQLVRTRANMERVRAQHGPEAIDEAAAARTLGGIQAELDALRAEAAAKGIEITAQEAVKGGEPVVSSGATTNTTNQFTANISITGSGDPNESGRLAKEAVQEWWDSQLKTTSSAVSR